jgi:hypothetical protein
MVVQMVFLMVMVVFLLVVLVVVVLAVIILIVVVGGITLSSVLRPIIGLWVRQAVFSIGWPGLEGGKVIMELAEYSAWLTHHCPFQKTHFYVDVLVTFLLLLWVVGAREM